MPRRLNDVYNTPLWCIEQLLPLINWEEISSFYEPCRGEDAIYDLIKVDHELVDLIITNPPYKKDLEFVMKSFTHSKTIIMLLRINFMGSSRRRRQFWVEHPPSHMIILSTRPSFVDGRTDCTEYAWFVWNGEGVIKGPTFQWIGKI